MKHLFTLGLVAAVSTVSAWAAPVTPQQALDRLNSEPQARRMVSRHSSAKSLKQIATLPELYVFSSGNGYIILPSDDIAQPLLAYSDSGEFDVEGNPALAWWLSTYSDQIAQAAAEGVQSAPIYRSSRSPIAPLTQTRWNQDAPYNNLCPELNGERSVTGCVATAMAQVLKFHNYPAQGTGTHSYNWKTGGETLSFDYGSTTFDWDNMLNTYDNNATAEQQTAVATLMKACGVSVDMNYTPQESGAASILIGPSLIEYFGYDKGLWQPERQYYGLDEWEDMIYSDLAQGLPVLYCGTGSAGGHQFVCDGYSSDGFFHFNWGWGGMSDGYFLLNALDPSSLGIGGGAGGFNSNQAVVLGVRPPVEGSKPVALVYCTGNFTAASSQAALGSQVEFTGGFFNYGCTPLAAGSQFGFELTADGSETPQYIVSYTLSQDLAPLHGYSALGAYIPANLANGTYSLRPAYKPADGEWQTMLAPLASNGELTATVTDGEVTFTEPNAPSITVSDITMTSDLYWGSPFTMTFNVTNNGANEYFGTVVPVLVATVDGEASIVAEGVTYPLDLTAGQTSSEAYTGKFSAGTVPAAGTYQLVLMSMDTGKAVSEPIDVELNAAPAKTTIHIADFTITGQDSQSISFSMNVECTEGYYAGSLVVAIFHEEGGSSITTGTAAPVYLGAGKSETTTATVNIASLTPGNYSAAVFHGSNQETSLVAFTVVDSSTGIDVTDAVSGDGQVYDLQGRRVDSPVRSGIYIVNHRLVHLTH